MSIIVTTVSNRIKADGISGGNKAELMDSMKRQMAIIQAVLAVLVQSLYL